MCIRDRGKIGVHLEQVLVCLLRYQPVEIDVQDVIVRGEILRGLHLYRLTGRPVEVERLPLPEALVLRGDPEEHSAQLQLVLGQHPKVLHLQFRHRRLEDVYKRQVTVPAASTGRLMGWEP